jgi:hypothetical protein
LYFILVLNASLIKDYNIIFTSENILTIILLYLISLNIFIPLLAFCFNFISVLLNFLVVYGGLDLLYKISEFVKNESLFNLERIQRKAISDNNSALMKSYELKIRKV